MSERFYAFSKQQQQKMVLPLSVIRLQTHFLCVFCSGRDREHVWVRTCVPVFLYCHYLTV